MRLKKLENQLQIEESGSKFATIQGKLAGFCSMFCILNDIEEDNLLTIKEEKELMRRFDDVVL